MSKKFPSKLERIDLNFRNRGRKIMDLRVRKGLATTKREDMSLAEFTRLAMRTKSWNFVEQELKNKPKRKTI